nr:MAG TPA: hypothetical protein [Bacteriophage sp.]
MTFKTCRLRGIPHHEQSGVFRLARCYCLAFFHGKIAFADCWLNIFTPPRKYF